MWDLAQSHLNPKGKNFPDRARGFQRESALLLHLGQTSYSLVYSLPCPGDHRFMSQDARQMTSRHVCIILITFTIVQCNFPKSFTYFISETVAVRILKYKPASVIHLWPRSSAIVKRERKKSWGEELFGVKKKKRHWKTRRGEWEHICFRKKSWNLALFQWGILLPHGFNPTSGPVVLWNISHRRCQL